MSSPIDTSKDPAGQADCKAVNDRWVRTPIRPGRLTHTLVLFEHRADRKLHENPARLRVASHTQSFTFEVRVVAKQEVS